MNKKNKVEKKRQKEQYVVEEMIRLYCRKNHKEYDKKTGKMCPSCQELSDYARLRSQKCPFMEEKTFCAVSYTHLKQPGNYLPVYSKTGRMGICRIFWSGISFMGNDLHNE